MAFTPVTVQQKQKRSKGGLFGQIAGSVVGGVAGAFTGNPIAGASAGGALGGAIGQVAGKDKVSSGGVPMQTAAGQDPEVMQARLVEARNELLKATNIPEPQKQQADLEVFTPAIEALRKQRGIV